MCDCTWLNAFSHAQSLLIKHKKIFECFNCFWKVFCFCKNVKNFKNSVALFWRLAGWSSREPTWRFFYGSLVGQCPSREKYLEYFSKFGFLIFLATQYGDLFTGGRSSHGGTQKFLRLTLRLPHGRTSSREKHLENFSNFLS